MSPALAGRFFTTAEAQLSFFNFFFFSQKSSSEPGMRAGWSQHSLTPFGAQVVNGRKCPEVSQRKEKNPFKDFGFTNYWIYSSERQVFLY